MICTILLHFKRILLYNTVIFPHIYSCMCRNICCNRECCLPFRGRHFQISEDALHWFLQCSEYDKEIDWIHVKQIHFSVPWNVSCTVTGVWGTFIYTLFHRYPILIIDNEIMFVKIIVNLTKKMCSCNLETMQAHVSINNINFKAVNLLPINASNASHSHAHFPKSTVILILFLMGRITSCYIFGYMWFYFQKSHPNEMLTGLRYFERAIKGDNGGPAKVQ